MRICACVSSWMCEDAPSIARASVEACHRPLDFSAHHWKHGKGQNVHKLVLAGYVPRISSARTDCSLHSGGAVYLRAHLLTCYCVGDWHR